MAGELHTVAEAAVILKVRESWLRTKASARLIPCTFVGKHLRFSDEDIAEIMRAGAPAGHLAGTEVRSPQHLTTSPGHQARIAMGHP